MYEDIIKDIRKRCRLGMNGVTSTSMREKGLNYKLNFGLNIPQIKQLASHYKPDKKLAETLWKEETRELKILATLLYPVNDFSPETADKWVFSIPNQEIREQLCINLLQHTSFASKLAQELSNSPDKNTRITGYWLLARMLIINKITNSITPTDSFKYLFSDLTSETYSVKNASLLALKHLGRQSKEEATKILNKISSYKTDADPVKQEIYESLSFEYEFHHR